MIQPLHEKRPSIGVLSLDSIANKKPDDKKESEQNKISIDKYVKGDLRDLGIGRNIDITACYAMVNLCYVINEFYKI